MKNTAGVTVARSRGDSLCSVCRPVAMCFACSATCRKPLQPQPKQWTQKQGSLAGKWTKLPLSDSSRTGTQPLQDLVVGEGPHLECGSKTYFAHVARWMPVCMETLSQAVTYHSNMTSQVQELRKGQTPQDHAARLAVHALLK